MSSERFKTLQTGAAGEMQGDGRLIATSASRNADAIFSVLSSYLPAQGRALEIASGSGQHIARYAREYPSITWQPSEVDPAKIASIQSWVLEAALENFLRPIILDATGVGWSSTQQPYDVIILVNLLHLISVDETESLIAEAAKALNPGGVQLIYGPFMRGDRFASEGDESFHNSLYAQDQSIGYKPYQSIQTLQTEAGLSVQTPHEMPANTTSAVRTDYGYLGRPEKSL